MVSVSHHPHPLSPPSPLAVQPPPSPDEDDEDVPGGRSQARLQLQVSLQPPAPGSSRFLTRSSASRQPATPRGFRHGFPQQPAEISLLLRFPPSARDEAPAAGRSSASVGVSISCRFHTHTHSRSVLVQISGSLHHKVTLLDGALLVGSQAAAAECVSVGHRKNRLDIKGSFYP